GRNSPAIVFSSVVLPAPLAPTSATTSPGSTCSETPWSASTPPPYDTARSRTACRGTPGGCRDGGIGGWGLGVGGTEPSSLTPNPQPLTPSSGAGCQGRLMAGSSAGSGRRGRL